MKVQRARVELARIRGRATVDGVTVVVDAEHRLLGVDLPDGPAILAAYEAARADAEPQVGIAMRELSADPHVQSARSFVEANTASANAAPADTAPADTDWQTPEYVEDSGGRFESGW